MQRYEPVKLIVKRQIPKLVPGVLTDPTRRLTRKLPVSHVFIASAYYYPKSLSLGDNAIALNFLVDSVNRNINQATFLIVGSNSTHQKSTIARTQMEPSESCRYATAVAITNNMENMTKLEIESDDVKIQIPFKVAKQKVAKPVIFCFSPQSLAEKWQLFTMHVHMSRRFGAHIHIYITSILESYFELMKEYENHGYITIDFWLKMKFPETTSPYFEPNVNTELANRAGAYTDCLLQYKEAAKYIAFLDLEDFIFPAMRTSFLREFNAEFEFQMSASSLYYPRRDHGLIRAKSLAEFSIYDAIGSLKTLSSLNGQGKVVVKPHRLNSTGIIGSSYENVKDRYTVKNNWIVHIPSSGHEIKTTTEISIKPIEGRIRPKDLVAIEENVWVMRNNTIIRQIATRLPKFDFYSPIVAKCLSSTVAAGPGKDCPNSEVCDLPQREDFKCVHSDAEFLSGPHMEPFTFHFANNSYWSYSVGCSQ